MNSNNMHTISSEAVLQVCLGHQVRRTARSFTREYDKSLQACGLNYCQFNLLLVIASLEPVPTPKISAKMAMDRTTLSRSIKSLKFKGYIDSQNGAGRRPDIISLTINGHTILAKAKALWQVTQGDLANRIGRDQAGQLLDILGKI